MNDEASARTVTATGVDNLPLSITMSVRVNGVSMAVLVDSEST